MIKIMDRQTGAEATAFVEMQRDIEAATAIAAIHGAELNGRALDVNEARPQLHRLAGRRSDRPE